MKCILRPNPVNAKQRGVALLVRNSIHITRYSNLEPINADMIVTNYRVAGLRYFVCSVYAPPNESDKLQDILTATQNIINHMPSIKVDVLMLLGDLNARHESWGDHKQNRAGITLLNFIQRLNMEVVYKHNKPTFLCDNGSSYIDLFVATENIARHCKNQFADNTVELFQALPIEDMCQ